VLIRALEPVEGLQTMAELRDLPIGSPPRLLTSGPGRLCRALAITRSACNGVDLLDPGSMLRLVRPAGECALPQVLVTPRIGIRKAVDRPLRFLLEGNAFVSGPRRGRASTPAAAEP
jgi:DNA-3-methyladenine glycosylase